MCFEGESKVRPESITEFHRNHIYNDTNSENYRQNHIKSNYKSKENTHLSSTNLITTDRLKYINPVTENGMLETKVILGNTKDSNREKNLYKINDEKSKYSQLPAHANNKNLVGTLETEVAEIITLFQNERNSQSETISKLNKEVERLNKEIIRDQKKPINKPSNECTDKGLQELKEISYKLQKESSDFKKQIIKLQGVIKEKNKKIDELENALKESLNKCRNYDRVQSEILTLRNLIEKYKLERKGSSDDAMKELIGTKEKVMIAQNDIMELQCKLKERDKEIQSLRQQFGKISNEPNKILGNQIQSNSAFEELIGKVQKLENFIVKGQKKHHKKAKKYFERIRDIERSMKSYKITEGDDKKLNEKVSSEIKELKTMLSEIEQKYTFQAACNKSLQESIVKKLLIVLHTLMAEKGPNNQERIFSFGQVQRYPNRIDEYSDAEDNEKLESLTVDRLKQIVTDCCQTSRGKRSISTNKRKSVMATSRKDTNRRISQNKSVIRGSKRHEII